METMLLVVLLQGDTKNDLTLFTLAALLSSTLVYNSRGTIDQQAVDRLRFVLSSLTPPFALSLFSHRNRTVNTTNYQ